jgi:hypothetical protein
LIFELTPPAIDMGYLLEKNRVLTNFFINFGSRSCVYPEASDQKCAADLLGMLAMENLARRSARAQSGKRNLWQPS